MYSASFSMLRYNPNPFLSIHYCPMSNNTFIYIFIYNMQVKHIFR